MCLRCLCISLLAPLVVSTATISFGIQNGNYQPKGKSVEIVCSFRDAIDIRIYRTTNAYLKQGDTHITACQITSQCIPGNTENGHYEFKVSNNSVIVKIDGLNRTLDGQFWHCVVKTNLSTDMENFKLIVTSEPTGIHIESKLQCDLANESCNVTCKTDTCTYPKPDFSWFYVLGGVSPRQDIFSELTTLTSDVAREACEIGEQIYKNTLYIPRYTTFVNNTAQTVQLHCRMKLSSSHQGLETNASKPIKFAVDVQSISMEPVMQQTLDLIENMPSSVKCLTSASRPNPDVEWKKQNNTHEVLIERDFTNEQVLKNSDLIQTESTLKIQFSRLFQGWTLACLSYKFNGTAISASKTLNIQYSANITSFRAGRVGNEFSTGNVTVNEHDNVSVECKTDSNPASSIQIQSDQTYAMVKNSSLAIHLLVNVTCLHSGKFQCKAWNNAIRSSIDVRNLDINVICAPRPRQVTDANVVAELGTDAVLSLSVLANPLPNSHNWTRNVTNKWAELSDSSKFHIRASPLEYNLTVMNVQREDLGEYKLTLSNGELYSFTFFLQNKGKPQTPGNIEITVTSATTVKVTWAPGYNGMFQQTFYVRYKATDENTWKTLSVPDPNDQDIVSTAINGLLPSKDYVLVMFASNDAGNSTASEPKSFSTTGTDTHSMVGIIGGAVGGILAVSIIVFILCILRRYKIVRDIQNRLFGQRSKLKEAAVTGRKRKEQCYENPSILSEDDSKKQGKKSKPAETKLTEPKQLQQKEINTGLTYVELTFKNEEKKTKGKKQKTASKQRSAEQVVYDDIQFGVVGEAYPSS